MSLLEEAWTCNKCGELIINDSCPYCQIAALTAERDELKRLSEICGSGWALVEYAELEKECNQAKFDRDKYIQLWRAQSGLSAQLERERDSFKTSSEWGREKVNELQAELSAARLENKHSECEDLLRALEESQTELSQAKHTIEQLVSEAANTPELLKELSRYRSGVEVDVDVVWSNYPWPLRSLDVAIEQFNGQRVRVLVMKKETE